MGFTQADYAVLFAYLIVVAALGSWFGRRMQDTRDYFLGGRDLPWWAVRHSIVATETSTLTFIGVPALAFSSNMTFLQMTFGYFIARIVISFLFIPAYIRGELFTAYQFLDRRFGHKTRSLASVIFLVTRVLADGVRLFATAIPLAIVTGMSYPKAIAIICVITVLYTYLGGIKAVVWMDVIQIVIYLAGAFVAVLAILHKLPGGWGEVVEVGGAAGKLKLFDGTFSFRVPYTIWSGILGGTFLTMASHGTDQLMVQRLLTCRSQRDSQKALIGSGFLIIAQFAFFLLIGAMLYVFYQRFPMGRELGRADEIFPMFIVDHLPAGVSGLVIAAIFAAAMSTLSGTLNSLASSTVVDLYKPIFKRNPTPERELVISRTVTLIWAAILIGVAALAASWGNVLEVGLTIASFTYGGLLGAFLLGRLAPAANQRGALTGMVLGLAAMIWVSTTAVAWPWYVLIGTSATFTVGLATSRVAGQG